MIYHIHKYDIYISSYFCLINKNGVAISGKRRLVGRPKQSFVPVGYDVESCVQKRERLLQSLSAHIPQALSVQYWRKEKEVHTPMNNQKDKQWMWFKVGKQIH